MASVRWDSICSFILDRRVYDLVPMTNRTTKNAEMIRVLRTTALNIEIIIPLLTRIKNVEILELGAYYDLTEPLESGIWTGCFARLTSLTLAATIQLLAELRLHEMALPKLIEFSLKIRYSAPLFGGLITEALQHWGDILIMYVRPFINNHRATLRHLGVPEHRPA